MQLRNSLTVILLDYKSLASFVGSIDFSIKCAFFVT